MDTLGRILKKARSEKGWTLREASENIKNISYVYLSEIESGKKVPDSKEKLESFALAYGISLEKLIDIAKFSKEAISGAFEGFDESRLIVARSLKGLSDKQIQDMIKIIGS